jgi:hypothetical protein
MSFSTSVPPHSISKTYSSDSMSETWSSTRSEHLSEAFYVESSRELCNEPRPISSLIMFARFPKESCYCHMSVRKTPCSAGHVSSVLREISGWDVRNTTQPQHMDAKTPFPGTSAYSANDRASLAMEHLYFSPLVRCLFFLHSSVCSQKSITSLQKFVRPWRSSTYTSPLSYAISFFSYTSICPRISKMMSSPMHAVFAIPVPQRVGNSIYGLPPCPHPLLPMLSTQNRKCNREHMYAFFASARL